MDSAQAFEEIRRDIAEGRTALVGEKALAIARQDRDPMGRVKCLSLLRVVEDGGASKEILRLLESDLPEDRQSRFQIAVALRGLQYPASALAVLKPMERDDPVRRQTCLCLVDMDEYEEALDVYGGIQSPTPFDRVTLAEIQSSLGMHPQAVETASGVLAELPGSYEVRRAYVSALIMAGREKDASKYARAGLKDKSADSNAIAAYVLRIAGNTKAAAGYATRAINIDNGHIGAMETLGICLAEKGEYDKARIVAGAINERSPGDRAAFNVLSYCEGH